MGVRRPILNVLVSGYRYAKTNCYISQILESLDNVFKVNKIFFDSNFNFKTFKLSKFPTLSLLQVRVLLRMRLEVNSFIKSGELLIYDQDPWESFMDTGTIKGAYDVLASDLNVKRFLVTSQWWVNRINSLGFQTDFIQMGILNRYHYNIFDYPRRHFPIFFQGTIHPYRRDFFNQMAKLGIDVTLMESSKYQTFLSNLRNSRIFLHTSPSNWSINGEKVSANCCWIKDLEAVSQGCISIRNIDEEYSFQKINQIPAIQTYDSRSKIPSIVEEIDSLSDQEIRNITEESRSFVYENMNWHQLVSKIAEFEK